MFISQKTISATVACLLAGTLLFQPSSALAYPASSVGSASAAGSASCQPASTDGQLTLHQVTDAGEVASSAGKVKALLSSRKIFAHADLKELEFSSTKVYRGIGNGKKIATVTVPLDSDRYSMMSGFTVVFVDDHLDNFGEAHVTKSGTGTFFVKTWANGKLSKSFDTKLAWETDEQLRQGELPVDSDGRVQPYGWGEKVGCVAATLGVSWKVAALITGLCGGACGTGATNPVSAGVCGACLGAYVTFGGTTLGAIYLCFTL